MSKVNTAVDFLKEGKSFRIGDIRLGINEHGDIEVAGWSQFINLENITKETSLKELNEIEFLFNEMIRESHELKMFLQGKSVVYTLYFDDYGKASIAICSIKDNAVKWHLNSTN